MTDFISPEELDELDRFDCGLATLEERAKFLAELYDNGAKRRAVSEMFELNLLKRPELDELQDAPANSDDVELHAAAPRPRWRENPRVLRALLTLTTTVCILCVLYVLRPGSDSLDVGRRVEPKRETSAQKWAADSVRLDAENVGASRPNAEKIDLELDDASASEERESFVADAGLAVSSEAEEGSDHDAASTNPERTETNAAKQPSVGINALINDVMKPPVEAQPFMSIEPRDGAGTPVASSDFESSGSFGRSHSAPDASSAARTPSAMAGGVMGGGTNGGTGMGMGMGGHGGMFAGRGKKGEISKDGAMGNDAPVLLSAQGEGGRRLLKAPTLEEPSSAAPQTANLSSEPATLDLGALLKEAERQKRTESAFVAPFDSLAPPPEDSTDAVAAPSSDGETTVGTLEKVRELIVKRDYAAARDVWERLPSEMKTSFSGKTYEGILLFFEEDCDRAATAFEEAQRMRPNDPIASRNLARTQAAVRQRFGTPRVNRKD